MWSILFLVVRLCVAVYAGFIGSGFPIGGSGFPLGGSGTGGSGFPLTPDQDCLELAYSGNCSFYTDCVETQILDCGPKGFNLAYGETYCNRFEEFKRSFNEAGQAWITGVQECLTHELFYYLDSHPITDCVELVNFGLHLYLDCYRYAGICEDILTDCTNLEALWSILDFDHFTVKIARQLVFETAAWCTNATSDAVATTLRDLQCSTGDPNFDQFIDTIEMYLSECNTVLDILYVIDVSDAGTLLNFAASLNSLYFDIGPMKTHISVVVYSDNVELVIPIGSVLDPLELDTAIRNITFTGGGTATGDAIQFAHLQGFMNSRQSEGVPQVMIILTDGVTDAGSTDPADAAEAARDDGIHTFVVGFGHDVDFFELKGIVIDAGPDFLYLFYEQKLESFEQEDFEHLEILQLTICYVPALLSTGNISGNLRDGEFRFLEYELPMEGLTLDFTVLQGKMSVYGSFTVWNPTPLAVCDMEILDITAGVSTSRLACADLFYDTALIPPSGGPLYPTLFIALVGEEENTAFTLETSVGGDLKIEVVLEKPEYFVREDLSSAKHLALQVCAVVQEPYTVPFYAVISTSNDTAEENLDFQPLKLELHFDPNFGSPRQCGCIHIIDDSIDEENESFSVHIYSITFCVELIGTTTADVTILDNDDGASCVPILRFSGSPTKNILIRPDQCANQLQP